ncbi:MAG: hypothetical protein JWO32_784 [Bacteroidetes bacterium]|nr:hypothetical protein [Bacteroidota bacterium]
MKILFSFLSVLLSVKAVGQVPVFSNDIPVTITGYTMDAMEPCISPDGNAMFFNSLNDGNTTSLYYAAKVNDSTFNLVGAVPVVNQTITPRLDGVASVDTANNFYWVSTRNYPNNMDNLFRIRFLTSSYTNFGRVHGDIYIYSPGWVIMDAAINYAGDKLIYCNAQFNGCLYNLPCKSALGYAQKTNDSTFTKYTNSTALLSNVNDTANYIIYAPQLSKDELQLYFTRALKNIPQTEICVSVRSSTGAVFGLPSVLVPLSSSAPEGPAVSSDGSKLYYHKKNPTGKYQLFLKYKTGTTGIKESTPAFSDGVYPNPTNGLVFIPAKDFEVAHVYNAYGEYLMTNHSTTLNLTDLPSGMYTIHVKNKQSTTLKRVILLNR